MRQVVWPILVALVLPLAWAAAEEPAGSTSEHVRVGPEKISLDGLRQLGSTRLLDHLNPKAREMLAEMAKKPEFRKLVEDMRRRQAGPNQPSPERPATGLNDLLRGFTRQWQQTRGLRPQGSGPGNFPPWPGSSGSGGFAPSPGGPGSLTPRLSPPASAPQTETPAENASADAQEDEAQQAFSKWLASQGSAIQKLAGPLTQSPAFNEALRQWTGVAAAPARGAVGAAPGAIENQVARLVNSTARSRVWPRFRLPKLDSLRLRGLGRMAAAGRRLRWSLPAINLPALGGGRHATVAEDTSSWLGPVLGLVLGLGLAAWLILRRVAGFGGSPRGPGWRLGDWPVDPAALATAEDVVRDFEYLSLLRLGRAARMWNHRDIAVRLATGAAEAPERSEAALHLASLYERARYAPGRQALDSDDVAAARREIALLAGVTTS